MGNLEASIRSLHSGLYPEPQRNTVKLKAEHLYFSHMYPMIFIIARPKNLFLLCLMVIHSDLPASPKLTNNAFCVCKIIVQPGEITY